MLPDNSRLRAPSPIWWALATDVVERKLKENDLRAAMFVLEASGHRPSGAGPLPQALEGARFGTMGDITQTGAQVMELLASGTIGVAQAAAIAVLRAYAQLRVTDELVRLEARLQEIEAIEPDRHTAGIAVAVPGMPAEFGPTMGQDSARPARHRVGKGTTRIAGGPE